jgi:hypothetical protein
MKSREGVCEMAKRIDVDAEKRAKLAAIAGKAGTARNLGSVEAFLKTLATPEGFERTDIARGQYSLHGDGDPAVEFTGDGVTVAIVMWDVDSDWSVGSGHVTFTTALGRKTFDRRGVEDSFYVEAGDTAAEVAARIAERLKDVAESRARLSRSETVPGLPGKWSVTPERKAEIAAKLKDGREHEFRPSGFGQGVLITRGQRMRYSTRLPAETMAFFGLTGTYYYDRTDCD